MRRKIIPVKINTTKIAVGSKFYEMLEAQRRAVQQKMGFKKNITTVAYTEMLARSGKLKIPKLNIDLFKNVQRKKFIPK